MKQFIFIISIFLFYKTNAQQGIDSIKTDFVLHDNRVKFKQYLIDKEVNETFSQPLDNDNEYKYEDACWSISQFALQSNYVEEGFTKMFTQYHSLQYSTQRSFMEAVYASYENKYENEIRNLISKEIMPKLFAMQALYLYRIDNSNKNVRTLETLMQHRFQNNDSNVILNQLKDYLSNHTEYEAQQTPNIKDLFANEKAHHLKTIYSFQRWNRDYPGLAIIQNEDGSFVKDSTGKLLMIEQLARSGSDLPYFITNGNTPVGIFSIQGVEVSHNHVIGPSPNIQLVMPFEGNDSAYFHGEYDSTKDAMTNYLNLLPASWKNYEPITQAFFAGKAGRTEIISHGSTLDPDFFSGKPFYPISPTMGCLCTKEDWNIFTGKLNSSGQFSLVHAFVSTPDSTGYLFVINLNNEQKTVTEEEVETIVKVFEK